MRAFPPGVAFFRDRRRVSPSPTASRLCRDLASGSAQRLWTSIQPGSAFARRYGTLARRDRQPLRLRASAVHGRVLQKALRHHPRGLPREPKAEKNLKKRDLKPECRARTAGSPTTSTTRTTGTRPRLRLPEASRAAPIAYWKLDDLKGNDSVGDSVGTYSLSDLTGAQTTNADHQHCAQPGAKS